MDRCETEIVYVIRPAGFIQQNVPVGPSDGAVIQVMDHRATVLFAQLPIMEPLCVEDIYAAFGKDQRLVRKSFMHQPNIIEHWVTTTPGLVPVITDAPDKPRGFRV